jgi:hypothetical protein
MRVKYKLTGTIQPGTQVNFWTVMAEAPPKHGIRHLRCRCICGTERDVSIGSLRTGASKSCQCKSAARKHGLHGSTEHMTWKHMKSRCNNPRDNAFKNYGGRGIRVCQRWQDSFEAFLADVGQRPDPSLTLDRINNEGHYEPGNVRWADRKTQANNTRWTKEALKAHGYRNAMNRWHPDRST